MKQFKIATTVFTAALMMIGSAACESGSQNTVPGGVSSDATTSGDDWRQITTFAQSIEDVGLSYDAQTKTAKLNFEHRDFDHLDNQGVPSYEFISELKGTLNTDGSATLANPSLPGYSAQVKCADPECLHAEIEITKISGRIAGTAQIKQTVLSDSHVSVGKNVYQLGVFPNGEQAELVNAYSQDSYTAELTVKNVVGGLKNFFSLDMRFTNHGLKPGDEGYFDDKRASVSGTIGTNVANPGEHGVDHRRNFRGRDFAFPSRRDVRPRSTVCGGGPA